MPSSPSRPPAAEEVSDDEMSDGEVPPRQSAASLVRGVANRAAPGSAGEEEEEIYNDDDDESSDYDNSYDDDDESDESGSYYEDGEEEEEEGARGDRAFGRAEEEEAAPAGVGGGAEAEGSSRAAATCCICMDSWASYGAHRICCIPCGHVYGRSCLERWLRRGGNTSAKCPQCSERFKHRHIINLYSSSVHLWNDCCLKEVALSLPVPLLYRFCSVKNDLLVANCRFDTTKSYVVVPFHLCFLDFMSCFYGMDTCCLALHFLAYDQNSSIILHFLYHFPFSIVRLLLVF
ncbi:unnamed protein product [Triticum turgidum subsp. durum]|uniref:RING-type domain-containing protein n=1 Tax=Triticum turgidum subsp. durum TaxID=4567 RepID=A0A9R0TD47_TRITD|nr:unnamed protein product [Triticum turgidum subsp. durum]